MTNAFPDHPFRSCSLRLRAQPGEQETSLTLQDEQGLDLSPVLFCTCCGIVGAGFALANNE